MAHVSAVNDIVGQARQGSVAAIIQVLNDALADSGIRTRAMVSDGILQLLCEAPTAAQLPQTEVVSRVKTLLEDLAPKHIRKVNINSRIVREQQLLWLEEITRDPENQLLWSELITLNQPNPLRRLWQELQHRSARPKPTFPEQKRPPAPHQYFWRGLIGGASLCMLLLLLGWVLKHQLGITWSQAQPTPASSEDTAPTPPPTIDVFAQAVELAQQAARDGQRATTPAEWLDLAARWQRASDLMAEVPSTDERYETAQDRVAQYQRNSQQALLQAEKLQQTPLESEEAAQPAPDSQ